MSFKLSNICRENICSTTTDFEESIFIYFSMNLIRGGLSTGGIWGLAARPIVDSPKKFSKAACKNPLILIHSYACEYKTNLLFFKDDAASCKFEIDDPRPPFLSLF